MNEKPEALRLADALECFSGNYRFVSHKAAAELRRLHAENERLNAVALQAQNAAIDLTKKNERLREALNRFEYSSDGHIKRYPEEEEVIAALRREET